MRFSNKAVKTSSVVGVYILVWWVVSLLVGSSLLLPGPVETVIRLIKLILVGETWLCLGTTMLRVISGLVLGTVFGVLFAILCRRFALFDLLFRPIKDIIKTTPVSSVILLLILWISSTNVPVVISILMVFPIVWANVYSGLCSCDAGLYEMTRSFRFSAGMRVRYYWIPSIKPYFTGAVSTSLGFAWKSAIAAEVLVIPKVAVGRQLYQAKLTLETNDLFAWTLLVIIVSFIIEKTVSRLLRIVK